MTVWEATIEKLVGGGGVPEGPQVSEDDTENEIILEEEGVPVENCPF